jgi:multidrug transporter EmrE-like cation transporter
MNSTLAIVLFVLAISVSECIAHTCLKKFNLDNRKKHFFLIGIVFYSIVCMMLILSYKYNGLGVINILWSGLSVLFIAATGALFFGDTLQVIHILGMGFILVGIGCVLYVN